MLGVGDEVADELLVRLAGGSMGFVSHPRIP
jgi:hypothetical protein